MNDRGWPWAYMTKSGKTLKAFHKYGDQPFKQSCPHCGIGQVRVEIGATCAYCRARVVDVSTVEERMQKTAQLALVLGV